MSESEQLIIRTPWRKQAGGIWLLVCALGGFFLWQDKADSSGANWLLVIIIFMLISGLYNLLTYSKTYFIKGEVPKAKQEKFHFGFLKKEILVEFDDLTILRRDNFLPYCQLYAFKKESETTGLIIVEQCTKKECEAFISQIWNFYGINRD